MRVVYNDKIATFNTKTNSVLINNNLNLFGYNVDEFIDLSSMIKYDNVWYIIIDMINIGLPIYNTITDLDIFKNIIEVSNYLDIDPYIVVDRISVPNKLARVIYRDYQDLMQDKTIECIVNDIDYYELGNRYELLDIIKNGDNSHLVKIGNIQDSNITNIISNLNNTLEYYKISERWYGNPYYFMIAGSYAMYLALQFYKIEHKISPSDIDIFSNMDYCDDSINDNIDLNVQCHIKNVDDLISSDGLYSREMFASIIIHLFDLDCIRFCLMPDLEDNTKLSLYGTRSSIKAIHDMSFTVDKYMASIPRTIKRVEKYRQRGFNINIQDTNMINTGNEESFYSDDGITFNHINEDTNLNSYLKYGFGIDLQNNKFISKTTYEMINSYITDSDLDMLIPLPNASTYQSLQYKTLNNKLYIYIKEIQTDQDDYIYVFIEGDIERESYRIQMSATPIQTEIKFSQYDQYIQGIKLISDSYYNYLVISKDYNLN